MSTLLAGCVPRKPSLQIPEEEFRQRVRTICVTRVAIPGELPNREPAAASIEENLIWELDRARFKMVDSKATMAVSQQVALSYGGAYDPHSGELDYAKDEEIDRAVRKRLADELKCDAVLLPEVSVVVAEWTDGFATWDGASDSLRGGYGMIGTAPALSLWVTIRDLDDKELYFRSGGIQLLTSLESGFTTGTRFEPVAEEHVLTKSWELIHSVCEAIRPLVYECRDLDADKHRFGRTRDRLDRPRQKPREPELPEEDSGPGDEGQHE